MTDSWSDLYGFNRIQAWFAAIARDQWQAPLGSSRAITRARQLAAVLARVKDEASAALKKRPSLTLAPRGGGGNMWSGRKNAHGAGRTKEW
jgi:hypothetical protein